MNKNLKQYFFLLFTSFMNEWQHTLGRIAGSKRFKQKAFVSGKHIALWSADGYHYFIDRYCSARYGRESKKLCAQSVIDCITEVENCEHKVFFDNWLLSLPLITVLKDQDIRSTETVWIDRLGKDTELNKKRIKTELWGTIIFHYKKSGIGLICCTDNRPVTVIRKDHTDLPLTAEKRCGS